MAKEIKNPTPDKRAFDRPYGTYRIKGDEKRTKYILIDSWRDTLKHKTIWRMMDETGSTVEVDCLKVVPYNSNDR